VDFITHMPLWLGILDVIVFFLSFVFLIFGGKFPAAVILGIAGLVTLLFYSSNPFALIVSNLDKIGEFIAIWLVLGLIWGPIRWMIYLNSSDTKAMILRAHARYKEHASSGQSFRDSFYYPFSFRKDSSMITTWIIFWPFSIIWLFFSHVLLNLGSTIWEFLKWEFLKWAGTGFSNLYGNLAGTYVDKVLKDKQPQP
jgi:hypothetical protein